MLQGGARPPMRCTPCMCSEHAEGRILQVFVAEGDPEKWELDGIVWKSSG